MGKLTLFKDDQPYEVLYDDEFEGFVASTGWYIWRVGSDGPYAKGTRKPYANKPMHRLLWTHKHGPIEDGLMIDHINGVKIDNRITNLRLTTSAGNNKNRGKSSVGGELYKGVRLEEGRYRAGIQSDKKTIFIGYFKTVEMAAIAYDIKAKETHGEFAWLNLPDATPEQIAEVKEMMRSGKKKIGAHSQYIGVTKQPSHKKPWSAQLFINGNAKLLHVGSYLTEREAALAYNEAALKHRGDKAKLNIL